VSVLLRLALRNLWRNPRRTLLTAGATFFAVGLTIFMEALGAGTHVHWIEEIVRMYPGHVEVMAQGYREHRTLDYGIDLDAEQVARLDQVRGIEGWAPRVETWALTMPDLEGELGRAAMLVGVDPKREERLSDLSDALREGRFVDGERGLVLGFLLARSMDLEIGDSVILLSSDYYGSQAADRYQLVGTLELGVTEFDQSLALLPLEEIQQFLDYGERVSHVALFAEQSEKTEAIAADASSIFDDDYEVVPWPTLMPDFAQLITLDDVANRLSLAILILVAGFGLLNTVLMTVLERVHEFGLMRAIGAKPRTLFLSVMLEASILALLGIAAGVLVAIPLVLYMEGHPIPLTGIGAEAMELFSVDPLLSFELQRKNLIGSSSIMFVVALMAALPPAWRASRGAPVDVMRSVRA
jgi:ABC-type lipoprotein release transport system permease subunit